MIIQDPALISLPVRKGRRAAPGIPSRRTQSTKVGPAIVGDGAAAEDFMLLPRSIALTSTLLARAVAGLAEAILYYQKRPSRPGSLDWIRDLGEQLSELGAMVEDSATEPNVSVPPAFVARVARQLDSIADQPDVNHGLAAAWRRDAMRFRAAADS